ncbi:PilC/PilY family type IV pilus protein, partial [Streptomyces clavuligerus]|uniref:PilC/PilY family type IV pilus protein n=1 Tax=Streptomyces clavuligerus TaxID=1901 RepID=UPI0018D13A14
NNNHQSYVDASPVVAEAQVANTGGATDWKTVLVSGTGAGGQGVFALDVTNPANFDGTKALWEFTSNEDADMGYVVGRPQVLKLRTNATGTPTYRWFSVVASGVNNYVKADSAGNYSDGNPTLFLLALD